MRLTIRNGSEGPGPDMAQVQARMNIKATLCGNRALRALTPQPARSVLQVSGARFFHADSFVVAIRRGRRS
jgi:hypothetical protein